MKKYLPYAIIATQISLCACTLDDITEVDYDLMKAFCIRMQDINSVQFNNNYSNLDNCAHSLLAVRSNNDNCTNQFDDLFQCIKDKTQNPEFIEFDPQYVESQNMSPTCKVEETAYLVCVQTNDSPKTICDPECEDGQSCNAGKCEDIDVSDKEECDPECDENQKCVKGKCEDIDVTDKEECAPKCNDNQKCVKGECLPLNIENCTEHRDCHAGEICIDGICTENPDVECHSSDDCPENSICTAEGKCISSPHVECDDATSCPEGKICSDDGKCIDQIDHDCKENPCSPYQICVEGSCQPNSSVHEACDNNDDCRDNLICRSHECLKPNCESNSDCLSNEHCVKLNTGLNSCFDTSAPMPCHDNYDCMENHICNGAQCIERCTSNDFCGTDKICDTASGLCKDKPPKVFQYVRIDDISPYCVNGNGVSRVEGGVCQLYDPGADIDAIVLRKANGDVYYAMEVIKTDRGNDKNNVTIKEQILGEPNSFENYTDGYNGKCKYWIKPGANKIHPYYSLGGEPGFVEVIMESNIEADDTIEVLEVGECLLTNTDDGDNQTAIGESIKLSISDTAQEEEWVVVGTNKPNKTNKGLLSFKITAEMLK